MYVYRVSPCLDACFEPPQFSRPEQIRGLLGAKISPRAPIGRRRVTSRGQGGAKAATAKAATAKAKAASADPNDESDHGS